MGRRKQNHRPSSNGQRAAESNGPGPVVDDAFVQQLLGEEELDRTFWFAPWSRNVTVCRLKVSEMLAVQARLKAIGVDDREAKVAAMSHFLSRSIGKYDSEYRPFDSVEGRGYLARNYVDLDEINDAAYELNGFTEEEDDPKKKGGGSNSLTGNSDSNSASPSESPTPHDSISPPASLTTGELIEK